MKKYIWIILGVIILAIVAFMCQPPPSDATNSLTFKGLHAHQDSIINANVKNLPNGTELAMAVIQDSIVQFYGIRREDDQLINVDNQNAVYEIGSISKVFTSTLLSTYVNRGDIQLDDRISDKLGYKFNKGIEVSYRELANHTSAIPRIPSNMGSMALLSSNPYRDYDGALLDQYCQEKIMQLSGEKKMRYSNTAVGLLGHTLEKVAGKSYEEMLQQLIVEKYGLNSTTSIRSNVQDKLIQGRSKKGNKKSNWDFNSLVGCGGIKSSVEDLAKFILAQFNPSDEVLNLTKISTFAMSDEREIGLGWFIINKKDSDGQVYWHNGMTGGYSSMLAMDEDNQNAVIVLSNVVESGGELQQISFGLLKSMLD